MNTRTNIKPIIGAGLPGGVTRHVERASRYQFFRYRVEAELRPQVWRILPPIEGRRDQEFLAMRGEWMYHAADSLEEAVEWINTNAHGLSAFGKEAK